MASAVAKIARPVKHFPPVLVPTAICPTCGLHAAQLKVLSSPVYCTVGVRCSKRQ